MPRPSGGRLGLCVARRSLGSAQREIKETIPIPSSLRLFHQDAKERGRQGYLYAEKGEERRRRRRGHKKMGFCPPPIPLPLSARTGRSRESRNNVWGGERKSWCVCFVGTDTSPSLPRPERSKVLITLIQALSCPSSSPSTQYDRHPPKGQPTSPLSLSSDKQERENKFRFPGWKLTWTDRPLDRPS